MVNMRFSLRNTYAAIPELFDRLQLPAGYDKQLFIDVLMDEYGDMGLARTIDQFPLSVELWGRRKAYQLGGLLATTEMEYNPIENYDRTEDITDTSTQTGSSQAKTTGAGDMDVSRAGMETEALKLDENTRNKSSGQADSSSTTEIKAVHTNRTHGNIGVTTTQEMIQQQRHVLSFDLYQAAANLFAVDLRIGIYL